MVKKRSKRILTEIPQYIKISLRNYLNTDGEYDNLKKQLVLTGVIIEKDDYQISISNVDNLQEMKEYLNEELELES